MREREIAVAFRSAVAWLDPLFATSEEHVPENLSDDDLIRELARLHGVRLRRVRLKKGSGRPCAVTPILAFTRSGRLPLVLFPSQGTPFDIGDPEDLQADAFQLYPRLPAGVLSFRGLLQAGFARRGKEVAGLLFPILLSALIAGGLPLTVYGALRRPTIWLPAAGICVLLAVVAEGASSIGALRLQGKLKTILAPGIWDRLLRVTLPFFRDTRPSEVAAAAGGMEDLCAIVTSDAVVFAAGIAGVCAIALVLAVIAPRAGLAVVGTIVVAAGVRVALRAGEIVLEESLQEEERRHAFFLRSLVWDLPHLRLLTADPALCANYTRDLQDVVGRGLRARRLDSWRAAVAAATPACVLLALVWCAPISQAAWVALLVGAAQLTAAAAVLEEKGGAAMRLRQTIRRLRPILTASTEPDVPAKRSFRFHGGIRLNHVTFRWPATEIAALEDVSLEIVPGDFIALAGPSGSGKSTLLRLLLGFDQPSRGDVEYDGQVGTSLDTETLRSQIEAVLQDQQLADGTIRTNLIGQSSRSLDDAWQAARLACVDEEIAAMPMGLQTFASESVLAAGQRQRLLLARAIVRRPALLILDESLSGLDERLQQRIIANLRGIPGLTCIVASHRPSMTALMDRTYRLERGRIVAVEQGHPLTFEAQNSGGPEALPTHRALSGLYRPEAVDRFESAEPLDRLVQLWHWPS
jgi:ABC-type bacteriocin/lantibiotic exporter with double-glycine peptidase domain